VLKLTGVLAWQLLSKSSSPWSAADANPDRGYSGIQSPMNPDGWSLLIVLNWVMLENDTVPGCWLIYPVDGESPTSPLFLPGAYSERVMFPHCLMFDRYNRFWSTLDVYLTVSALFQTRVTLLMDQLDYIIVQVPLETSKWLLVVLW
jgi:hypothetical protein